MRSTVVAAALFVATLGLVLGTSALTIRATYQARYGSNGTVTVRTFSNGTSAAIVNLYALPAGRTYTFRLAIGSCTSSTSSSIPARVITVASAGKVSQTWTLTVAQTSAISSKLAAAKVVAILSAGSSRICRTLAASTSKPIPTPTPTPTPPGGIVANVSTHQFGYGPTLTPSSMSDWFPALKLNVPASVTATVTAGQNVYALLVVPPGGSVTFKVTTSSGGSGGWYWQWDTVNKNWITPELYFYEGQFVTLHGGTTWVFGLDFNSYAGSETLTITPTAISKP